mmetsp:Transcript_3796/g.8132  ORF Transcript_3796/g.8132 Transcript_3796/m.8132 type:complete len:257 (-) Transcript_3796:67-837(-)
MMHSRRDKLIRESDDPRVLRRAARRAAVLVPLCTKNGQPAILFNVRSHRVSTHKGQVAFPGGHIEPGEAAPAAALRELEEEVGVPTDKVELIARCAAIPAITGTTVTPVLGLLDQDIGEAPHSSLTLCDDEVDFAFALTLDELFDPSVRYLAGDDCPGLTGAPIFQGKAPELAGTPVWGLTAIILDGILNEFLAPALGRERFQYERPLPWERPGGGIGGADESGGRGSNAKESQSRCLPSAGDWARASDELPRPGF